MPEQEFKEWYDWLKADVDAYQDVRSRTSAIAGFFAANHEEVFTGEQVCQILALRYRKKDERPREPASSGALVTNQLYLITRRCECT